MTVDVKVVRKQSWYTVEDVTLRLLDGNDHIILKGTRIEDDRIAEYERAKIARFIEVKP
mgnify:CR=1 FL=1